MSNPSRQVFSALLALVPGLAWAQCDQPAPRFTLPHLAAALATHQLNLLVIAPAIQSPAAADNGADDGSLPFRIQSALRAQRPDLAIDLDTLDNTGQSVADMLPILADRLAQRPAVLVVWQAGEAEIARALPAATASTSFADAARLINADNADLILVDPDPNPVLRSQPDFPAIEAVLAQTATHPGTALYQQHDADPACSSHGIAHLIAGF